MTEYLMKMVFAPLWIFIMFTKLINQFRGIFRTQPKTYNEHFFGKIANSFNWVLNTLLPFSTNVLHLDPLKASESCRFSDVFRGYRNDTLVENRLNIRCQLWNSDDATTTAQKRKFSIKDFFSKCNQICRKLRIWLHLLKKSFMENFIFCAVYYSVFLQKHSIIDLWQGPKYTKKHNGINQNLEADNRNCSAKSVFLKISKNPGETFVMESF